MKQDFTNVLEIMKLYRLSHRRVHLELSSTLSKAGLTPLQFNILELLYEQGELTISQLMNQLCATKGNMTVVIKNMVDKEWIYRLPSESDKRSSIIGLLPEGRKKTESYLPIHHETIRKMYESFSNEELMMFGDLLHKINERK
ncbi:MarR family winged helix-turn-helix transcriptional regulator [Paenibacillus xylaniclasticus]|uniref:MarR family winged helix-turn-helix transcriptional regulator n=1 Tax=Paenibacillus xylaniclasticus TaxID=588083 RepID=UPI000FDA528C|nr:MULTISPECIES: MarR family transcriptional regulator [Paenibacillus]GFN32297.1 MarR family transcriptional regulator [Paenibacillus curdlanolyticus]